MPLAENKTTGYIRIYRSLKKHWLWNDANRLKWWLTILMEVNHTDKKTLIQGTLYDCMRGQSLNSIETWSKEFRCSIQQVRTFFSLLKKDAMIELEGMQKTTRLTVCNYVDYNKIQRTDNEQITNRKQADNKQITTNNNDNNLKNEKNVCAHMQEEIKLFDKFLLWMQATTPRVLKMNSPLTIDEYFKLKNKLTGNVLENVLKAMENRADLLKKYVSAYLTILSWAKHETNGSNGKNDIHEALKQS